MFDTDWHHALQDLLNLAMRRTPTPCVVPYAVWEYLFSQVPTDMPAFVGSLSLSPALDDVLHRAAPVLHTLCHQLLSSALLQEGGPAFRTQVLSMAGSLLHVYLQRGNVFWQEAVALPQQPVVENMVQASKYESGAWSSTACCRAGREYDMGRPARNRLWGTTADQVERTCSKYVYHLAALVPGIMLCLCAMCQGVRGFQVMASSESPATVFRWMMKHCSTAPRYVGKALHTVIYY